MKKKKAQVSGLDAATLILLIGLFIFFYLLLVPPSEREKLLNETVEGGEGELAEGMREGKTLLSTSPGEVYATGSATLTKDISPISLFSKTDQETINLASSIIISKSLLRDNSKTLDFSLDDIDNIEKVDLFFFIKNAEGQLKVELNDHVIYEKETSSDDLPISLPTVYLNKYNTLRLSVSSGILENKYELSNIYIRTEFRIENKIARRNFILTSTEKALLDKATLYYFLNCLTLKEQGMLTILVNNKLLRSDYVVCDVGLQSLGINKINLISGDNTLEFRIDKGDYRLEDMELDLNLMEKYFPKYSFEVSDDDFDKISNYCYETCVYDCDRNCETDRCYDLCVDDCAGDCDIKRVNLGMLFGNDGRKKAAITINEFEINFDVYDIDYYVDITKYIRRGSNYIKIIPKNNFEIDYLRIFLD